MQQISWQEDPGAKKFDMAAKFLEYMKDQQTAINAESTNRVPQLLNAIESDLLVLQQSATSPNEVSMFNGIQADLNMFKAFAMNSGKWTWNSDLDLGTTNSPHPPPAPGSATYACSDSPDVSTCSQAAAPSDMSTTQSPQPTTPSLSNPQGTSCPPDQVMSCGQVGMGDHAFASCACFATQESTSEMSTTQPPTSPGPGPGPGATSTSHCLPDQIMTCSKFGMGEHGFSSCGCVVTRQTMNTVAETTWVTVVGCPSGHTSTCVQNGFGQHAYSSCACVVATGPLSPQPPPPPPPSLAPAVPSPSPLLPQVPESGTMSEPAFVTTCVDMRDILASYTLCPRDETWVKVAEFSTVQGHEEH